MNLLHMSESILDFRAVATRIWSAPGHNPPSMAPDSKSSFCCHHFCLLCNGCQVFSILKPCSLEGLHRISQDVPLCRDKLQEALFKIPLGNAFQVPNFGGLRHGKLVPFSTHQGHIDLQHWKHNQNATLPLTVLLFRNILSLAKQFLMAPSIPIIYPLWLVESRFSSDTAINLQ